MQSDTQKMPSDLTTNELKELRDKFQSDFKKLAQYPNSQETVNRNAQWLKKAVLTRKEELKMNNQLFEYFKTEYGTDIPFEIADNRKENTSQIKILDEIILNLETTIKQKPAPEKPTFLQKISRFFKKLFYTQKNTSPEIDNNVKAFGDKISTNASIIYDSTKVLVDINEPLKAKKAAKKIIKKKQAKDTKKRLAKPATKKETNKSIKKVKTSNDPVTRAVIKKYQQEQYIDRPNRLRERIAQANKQKETRSRG